MDVEFDGVGDDLSTSTANNTLTIIILRLLLLLLLLLVVNVFIVADVDAPHKTDLAAATRLHCTIIFLINSTRTLTARTCSF